MDNIPRRCCIDKFTPAEKTIYDTIKIVENLGCSVHLTDAINHLQKAQFAVADFVDCLSQQPEKSNATPGTLAEHVEKLQDAAVETSDAVSQ